MSATVVGFAVICFAIAYLAINTPKEYASLQIGNYIFFYISVFATVYLAYGFEKTNVSPAEIINSYSTGFSWILLLVVAVFLIKILNNVLEEMGVEVLE